MCYSDFYKWNVFLAQDKHLDYNWCGSEVFKKRKEFIQQTVEDHQRLILRFWNVRDRTIPGSLNLPTGWTRAQMCDALERPVKPLDVTGPPAGRARSRIRFGAEPLGVLTVAISKGS